MTDNLFDNGEPITAVPTSEKVESKPARKTTQKRRGATKRSTKATTPEMPKLGIYRLHSDVQTPAMATDQAACFDMRAYLKEGTHVTVYTRDNVATNRKVTEFPDGLGIVLNPGERVLMPTGIIFDIPEGYSVRAHPRSGCSLKEGLTLINGEGVIDSDYVHEGFMPLVNHSGVRLLVKHGERCAQVEMVENLKYEIEEIRTRPTQKTNRSGGFGHSGKK